MKSKTIDLIRYRLPAIVWAFFIFIASSIPSNRIPNFLFKYLDKPIHILIFGVLGVLVYRALEPDSQRDRYTMKTALMTFGIVLCYGIIDEFHQGYTPGRSVDLYDLMADAVGGILAVIVIYLWRRRRNLPAEVVNKSH